MHGPLMWISKRQTYTARSSVEAEIYATDECAKNIIHLMQIIVDIGLTNELISGPLPIWNDNSACVAWSKNTTTKGLRHVQIRENAVREGIEMGIFTVTHIEGKKNPSDIFTKEDKDTEHFVAVRNSIMCDFDTVEDEANKEIKENKTEKGQDAEIVAQQDTRENGGCQVGNSPSLTSSTH